MRVLVACEFSGIVRDAFKAMMHDAWSCDLLPTERRGPHIQADVASVLNDGWDMLIAHPPCTYLCNSGVCWLYTQSNRYDKMLLAKEFFLLLYNCSIPRIAVENPIPHKYASLPAYTQIIQPWQFGHGETKATCLWLKNLPELKPTNIVSGRVQRSHWESPSKDRWKNRSRTYQGIADAMARQWYFI